MSDPVPSVIRLMLLDDHEFVLCGMEYLLADDATVKVHGRFTRSRELLNALAVDPVDIVVMDFSLGPDEVDGLNLIRALRSKFPTVQLLVISAYHTPATVSLALRCGARGFIGKGCDTGHLLSALQELMLGNVYLEPDMAAAIHEQEISTDFPGEQDGLQPGAVDSLLKNNNLTIREREVLRCCLSGMSVTQVAEKFCRSIKTISTQKQAAYRKLGVRTDNELFKMRSQLEGR